MHKNKPRGRVLIDCTSIANQCQWNHKRIDIARRTAFESAIDHLNVDIAAQISPGCLEVGGAQIDQYESRLRQHATEYKRASREKPATDYTYSMRCRNACKKAAKRPFVSADYKPLKEFRMQNQSLKRAEICTPTNTLRIHAA